MSDSGQIKTVINNQQPSTNGQSQETINALVQQKLISIESKIDTMTEILDGGVVRKDIYKIENDEQNLRITRLEKALLGFVGVVFMSVIGYILRVTVLK
jgi:hypothetical protein